MEKVKILKLEDREKLLGKILNESNDKSLAPRCPGMCPSNPCRIIYKQYKKDEK